MSKLFVSILILIGTQLSCLTAQENPDSALQRLKQGNQRFMNDKLEHPDRTEDRRTATADQQKPFAVVLGCSDSRVPPEIVFDQGIGDIFTVRVAGNVLGPLELDSIEYSVIYNSSVIVVVLGHENCGAIKAVLANNTNEIETIADYIRPALYPIKHDPEKYTLENAIKANVKFVTSQLQRSPVLAKYINNGRVKVLGAYYNFTNGKVDFF